MKKLIMMVVLMPLMASAYNTWTDPKTGITWTYVDNGDGTLRLGGGSSTVTAVPKDTKGELVIPASIVGLSVSDIDDYAFFNCRGLTSLSIPSSVSWIGNRAFDNCSKLTSVTIPESVTYLGRGAFGYCSGLESITVPFVGSQRGNSGTADSLFGYIFGASSYSGATRITQSYGTSQYSTSTCYIPTALKSVVITDETKIGYGAFYGCSGLTSLTISSSVTSIESSAFYGCSGLTSLTIPSSVISIESSVFYGCTSLTLVTIPSSVTSIGEDAFKGCAGLSSVTIPSSVTNVGEYAFSGCSGLTSVTIPTGVTSIGRGSLYGCTGLESVTIPSSVTSIGDNAFKGCAGLSSVTIPSSVMSIGDNAFSGCSGLTSVTIPSSVTSIGSGAFSGCSGLTSVTLPFVGVRDSYWGRNPNFGSIFGTSPYPGATATEQNYYIPDSLKSVVITDETEIKSRAFLGCSGLESVTIPSSVTKIGECAFDGCSGLTSITIPSSVTSIGRCAFRGCSGLADMNGLVIVKDVLYDCCGDSIAVVVPSSVTTIGEGAFSGCSGLESVMIPLSVTTIGEGAFSGCSGLESVTIPSSVTSIGGAAFVNCDGLTSVTIPSGVMNIEMGTFSGCSGLTSITLPFVGARRGNGGTADLLFGYIFGTSAYSGATATKQYYSSSASSTYYIPDALKSVIITDETKIGYGAFYNCSGLTSVTIPNSVISVEEKAFYGCSGLGDGVVANDGWVLCVNGSVASAEIPDGVKQIVPGAFAGHTELKSVKLPPSLERVDEKDFSGCSGLEGVYITDLAAWCGMAFESAKANPLYYAKKLYLNEKELIYLDIPKGVEEIGQYAFYNCNRFMSVTIPPSVKSVGRDAFGGCSGLSAVNVSDLSAWCGINFASAAANPLYCAKKLNLNGNEIVDLAVPSGTESIGQYAFYNGVDIASVTIPNSVTSIGTDAFKGCTGVKSATVPERFTLSSVFPDSYANIPTVTIPADAAFIADGAFSGCSKIKSIEIPSTVTCIGANAFSGCSGLTAIAIPASVTGIGASAFYGCTQIAEIEIPEGVGELPGSLCEGCTGLTTVVIPNSVSNISSTAFKNCGNIVSVTMPRRFAMKDVFPSSYSKIQDVTILDGEEVLLKGVFTGCSALSTVVISEGVTTLGEDLFYGKANLKELTIPSTVTSIGGYALYGCTSLEVIHVSNDGDIDALKQMLYESGFDVESVTFDHVEEPVYVYYKVAFDAQGGVAKWTESEVREGKPIGELPPATREGYEFLGWFTAAAGGTQVTAATVVTKDVTFYAQWRMNIDIEETWATDEEFSAEFANAYDGYVIDVDRNVVEIVQVKTAKQTVKKTTDRVTKAVMVTTNITATATVTDANGKKWSYSSGSVTVDDVVTGLKCTAKGCPVPEFGVTLGKNGMEGAWGEYAIFGARNGMGTKGDEMMAELEHYKGKWSVTIGTLRLQLNVQAKGVVKIAGNWENGAKVSASAQMVMGDGFAYVPVMVKQTKTSPAMNALLKIAADGTVALLSATDPSHPEVAPYQLKAGGRTVEELGEPECLPSEVSAGGKAFSARVAVNELVYPAKFAAKKLPAGLKIDAATGVISGTPTKPGHYVAEVTVTSGLNSKVKKTITVEFDIANYTDDIIQIEDSYGPYYVGVSTVEQIAAAAGCSVSGLPSGLKWTAKDIVDSKTKAVKTAANTVYGVPTKACTNTVYFKKSVKETVDGKTKTVTHQASATFVIEGMQPWAVGTFNGGSANGMVTLTVSNVGKISGKWMCEGLTWTLSAASYDAYYSNEEKYVATVVGKSGMLVMTNEIEVTEGGVVAYDVRDEDTVSTTWEAWKNEWKEEPLTTLAKQLNGKKMSVGDVDLTVGASGTVTAKGAFVGLDGKAYSTSCSTVLIPTAEAGLYRVYLYFPPKAGKFDGFTDVVEIGFGE